MSAPKSQHFDVLIMGSGLGGLLCGYLLAERGFSVCVLEKNVQFGGCLQVFSREKTVFDTGVHYIGELGEGEALNRVFSYFGLMEKLQLEKLDADAFDVISFEGDSTVYPFAQGHTHFVEKLSEIFPEERVAIQKYTDTIKQISESFYANNLRNLDLASMDTEAMRTDAEAFITSLTENIKLRNVLAGNIPLYGGIGGITPLHQHALIVNSYLQSAWRCVDGGAQIAKHLTSAIRNMGGTLLRRKNVFKLEVENGLITKAVCADGESYTADRFVANFPPEKALEMLQGAEIRKSYQKRIADIPGTTSFFGLYIVFKPESFPYLRHNVYHYNNPDVWRSVNYNPNKWPESWLMYPAAMSQSSEFAQATTILAYMHYDEVKLWEQSFNTTVAPESRGPEYEAFKQQKAELLINAVEKRFPGFKNAIQSYHTSTPLTYRDYLNVSNGSAYGKLKNFREPHNAFISPRSKITNLFFTGQSVHLHGIKGVTTSAIVTSAMMLGKNDLFEKMLMG
jgi:all-trans-retinol 13,14-reductase